MNKILVIEDDPAIRSNVVALLEAEGFEAHEAADGTTGIAAITRVRPDLVICDLTMPDVDGLEVLRAVRAAPATAELPFIVLTARGSRADVRAGMSLGADDYLTKPFTRAELLEAIRVRLARSAINAPPAPRASSARRSGDGPTILADRYEIESMVGAGGMGVVYRVRDLELDETVALKVMSSEFAADSDALGAFRQEVKLARRVTHPNVARTFDIGETDEHRFLTMEYVVGESLAAVLARRRALPLDEALRVGVALAAGLEAAHTAGVVHRDLKPENVLMTEAGRIVITDFGVARAFTAMSGATPTGRIVGTAAYMAPEQVECAPGVDARADIYALGCVLYEMLTGARAWPGDSFVQVSMARLMSPPPNPRAVRGGLPPAICALVVQCLATRREDRWTTAAELAAELTRARGELGAASAIAETQPEVPAWLPRDLRRERTKTVAVIPGVHESQGGDDAFARGVAADVARALSDVPSIFVKAPGLAAREPTTHANARRRASELNAHAVAVVSPRLSARGALDVGVRVVDVANGFVLAATTVTRSADDAFGALAEVTRAIAATVTSRTAGPSDDARGPGPGDAEAAVAYLRARGELVLDDARGEAARLVAVAVERAPQIAEIAALHAAVCAAAFAAQTRARPLDRARALRDLAELRRAADLAIACGPGVAEGWTARGAALLADGDWLGAGLALHEALRLAPFDARAHHLIGTILADTGALAPATAWFDAALTIDRRLVAARAAATVARALAGDWADVRARLASGWDGDTEGVRLDVTARLALWCGGRAGARAEVAPPTLPPVGPAEAPSLAAAREATEILATRVAPDHVRAWIDAAAAAAPAEPRAGRELALEDAWRRYAELAAVVGDDAGAAHCLARAVDAGLGDLAYVDRCPLFGPLRREASFAPLRAIVRERGRRAAVALRR
jgi:serine/threonine-protein kinase